MYGEGGSTTKSPLGFGVDEKAFFLSNFKSKFT